MWKWAVWITTPVACFIANPAGPKPGDPISLPTAVMGVWFLSVLYLVVRGWFRWRGRQLARGWQDEIQRRQ